LKSPLMGVHLETRRDRCHRYRSECPNCRFVPAWLMSSAPSYFASQPWAWEIVIERWLLCPARKRWTSICWDEYCSRLNERRENASRQKNSWRQTAGLLTYEKWKEKKGSMMQVRHMQNRKETNGVWWTTENSEDG
jgi:hypothetical protein